MSVGATAQLWTSRRDNDHWRRLGVVLMPTTIHPFPNQSILRPSNDAAHYLFGTHPTAAAFISIIICTMIICTLVGNGMVCLAVALVRKLKSQPANLLLVSLAVADFSVGLFVMPIALVDIVVDQWVLGDVICRLWTSADLMLCSASILNLCAISVDRYLAVTQPLTYSANRTRRRILCYILIVWICALLVSTTPLIVLPTNRIGRSCQVSQNPLYQIYATILSFYGPCLIMVILYWRMWKAAKRLQKRDTVHSKTALELPFDRNGNSLKPSAEGLTKQKNGTRKGSMMIAKGIIRRPSALLHAVRVPLIHSHSRSHEKTEDKARKTLGVIMSVFIICWLPFFIVALVKSQFPSAIPWWLDVLSLWLGYSNSFLNPIIYCKYNREFRIPFREMLCCRFRTIQTVMRNESFYSKFGPPSELRSSTVTAAVSALPKPIAEEDFDGLQMTLNKNNNNNNIKSNGFNNNGVLDRVETKLTINEVGHRIASI